MYWQIAKAARLKVMEMIFLAQTSHIGSNFSCIDILTVLFEKANPAKDEVILSAGWKAAAWYYFLWKKGIITEDELNSFCQSGSRFIGLVEPIDCQQCNGIGIDKMEKTLCLKCNGSGKRWGLRFGGGSMGLAFPAAVGFALTKKMKKEDGRIYVLMSDGEMQCGTTWESALIAAHHQLDNLIVIVDYNQFQAMGKMNEILNIEPIGEKWRSFGWHCWEMDGHKFSELEYIIQDSYKPRVVIAHTIKGKGVSKFENNNLFHYKAPSEEEYVKAVQELNG